MKTKRITISMLGVSILVLAGCLEKQDSENTRAALLQNNVSLKKEIKNDLALNVKFKPIYFNFDSYVIKPDQKRIIEHDLKLAKQVTDQERTLLIKGYSDQHFISDLYNRAVSLKRAYSVAQELTDQGISKNKIKVVGYGDDNPVIDLPGEKIEKNRRVEFTILHNL